MPQEHASAKATMVVNYVADVKMDGRVISVTQLYARLAVKMETAQSQARVCATQDGMESAVPSIFIATITLISDHLLLSDMSGPDRYGTVPRTIWSELQFTESMQATLSLLPLSASDLVRPRQHVSCS